MQNADRIFSDLPKVKPTMVQVVERVHDYRM